MVLFGIMCIEQPVGRDAPNLVDDVALIQALINLNLARLSGVPFLSEDGAFGPHTQAAIEVFQRAVVTPGAASGVIEPGSATLQALRSAATGELSPSVLQILMPLSSMGLANRYFQPMVG